MRAVRGAAGGNRRAIQKSRLDNGTALRHRCQRIRWLAPYRGPGRAAPGGRGSQPAPGPSRCELRLGWFPAQGAVRSDDVAVAAPLLDEFVDDIRYPVGAIIMCRVLGQIIGPDAVRSFRPQSDTGTVVEPELDPFRLLLVDLEPFARLSFTCPRCLRRPLPLGFAGDRGRRCGRVSPGEGYGGEGCGSPHHARRRLLDLYQ